MRTAFLFLLPSAAFGRLLPQQFRLPAHVSGLDVDCPCDDASLCDVLSSQVDTELFGFGADNFADGPGFDWDAMTTIAWGSGADLICKAHSENVRVIAAASPPLTDNQTAIDEFIHSTIKSMQQNFYDGITFDWESPVDSPEDPLNTYYLDVVSQTTAALKAVNPDYQVSLCAAWSPFGIDGRWYDYVGLAAAVDFLYVMCYDVRSQIFDQCVASANSPINLCKKGIEEFNAAGISNDKLVLGMPWYGYRYECVNEDFDVESSSTCEIAQVPFRGVNCSDAAGSEIAFGSIRNIVRTYDAEVRRDPYMNVPFFNYVDSTSLKTYQIWYDDADSLQGHYDYVREQGLRGAGPYRFDQVDLDSDDGVEEAKEMFAALKTAAD
ncbi:hypothetical protein TrST_g9136 [Triparma strigata]|uniref:GH18 domain-containing protein n=1 Tax=Triparma strigata TaxID=1606541 RepID=A0A9W7F3Q1_9STRA|nr:hypothetical protein TrST_g9136 [Triparma strigata]